MGILLSNYKSAYNLSEKIWSIREILLLSFFISIGMQITLDANVLGILTILITLLIIKSLILFFLLIFFKLRAYTSFLIVISLSTYSEFSLIVLSLLTKNVTLDSIIVSGLIVSVCVSFILAAILNKYAHQIYERTESFFIKFERKTRHPDEEPHTCGDAEVMIIGMGRFGNAIFDNLLQNNIKTVGFDSDTDLITNLLSENKRVTFADAEDPGFWSQLRFGKLKSIILAIPEYEAQIWSTKQARKYGFEGDIIIPDASANLVWTYQAYKSKKNQKIFTALNHSPMGYSVPAAIGPALTTKKNVIAIIGDGSMQMNIQEIENIKAHNLNIKIFLINNFGYGMVKQTIDTWLDGNYVGCDTSSGLSLPDFSKVFNSYGIKTLKINNHNEMHDIIDTCLNLSGPVMCEVIVNEKQRIIPKTKAGSPLHDMLPKLSDEEIESNIIK